MNQEKILFLRVLLVVKFDLSLIVRIKINIYYEVPRCVTQYPGESQSVTLHTVFVALLPQSITVPTTEALLLETCIGVVLLLNVLKKRCRVVCGDLLLLVGDLFFVGLVGSLVGWLFMMYVLGCSDLSVV